MKWLFVVCIIFSAGTRQLAAQDNLIAKKIANEILTNSHAYPNLRFICKEIGPRLSGSANASKAITAAARMLKEAGADTVYLQPCMVPRWQRGKQETGFMETRQKRRRELRLCALGGSVATGTPGIGGDVVEVKTFSALDSLGNKVRDKIVFFNFVMNPVHINTFRAYSESGIARRIGAAQAAKYGAVAVMVRSLASNVDGNPHTGAMRYNDSFPKIPAVAISTADAEWLSKTLMGEPVTAWYRTSCITLPEVESYNVVGEIRGSALPEEIITVGGHLDSWDLGEGAHDDGAGIVQSIEVIRALKATGVHPKRTIRAVMFMNEENGLRGGEAYLKAAKERKEQHVFALESDAGGFTPRGFNLDMDADKIDKILNWKNLFQPYGVYDFAAGGSGADIGGLKELGTALAGLSLDSQRYFDIHHAATDVFESVNERELLLGTINMAIFIWLVSEYGL